MSQTVESNVRQEPDELLNKIADYALSFNIESEEALLTARYCLMAVSYTHLTLPTTRLV